MSSTCGAPPHISAASATVARATTCDNGLHPSCLAPSNAPVGSATLSSLTSHNFRVSSIVGNTVIASPGVPFGTRNRLTPSSIVLPSPVPAATTRMSARCASPTNSLVPERVTPPPAAPPPHHLPPPTPPHLLS